MGFTYSVGDHSPHNFGPAFNSGPLRRAQFSLVLSRLKACAAKGALLLLAPVLASSIASAQQKAPDQTPPDLANLSLEELMNVNIYTASKRWQKIVDAPAQTLSEAIRRALVPNGENN